MEWLGTLFLYLHVSGVIVAFGPSIAFPFFAAKAATEPVHGNFVLRVSELIGRRLIEPAAVFVFLMGVGLILTRGYNPLAELWLAISIVLFIIVFAYANLVQERVVRRMIELTSPPIVAGGEAQPGDVPTQAGPGATAADGAAVAGPPPEFFALSKKAARGGQLMLLMVFVLVALMVFKPNF